MFHNCTSLKTVNLHKGITKIANHAFYNCVLLENINLPDSTKELDYMTFTDCTSLKKIRIPSSVDLIHSLFKGCNSLEEIEVDTDNKAYCDENGVLFNKSKILLIKFPENKIVPYYQIPNTVKVIQSDAFSGCKFIKQITQAKQKYINGELKLPLSLQYIDPNAFADCENLKSLELVNYVSLQECFNKCSSLDHIKITKKQLNSDNSFLNHLKKKHILSIENIFIILKLLLECKVDFKFTYYPLTRFYLLSWLF